VSGPALNFFRIHPLLHHLISVGPPGVNKALLRRAEPCWAPRRPLTYSMRVACPPRVRAADTVAHPPETISFQPPNAKKSSK